MFGRFQDGDIEQEGSALPQEWQDSLLNALDESYKKESAADECFFDVYARIYDQEFVVAMSYVHKTDQLRAPITLFISHDVIGDEKEFTKALTSLLDLSGLIWDDIFSQRPFEGHIATWTENEFDGHKFYYKITRENLALSLQAKEILAGNI